VGVRRAAIWLLLGALSIFCVAAMPPSDALAGPARWQRASATSPAPATATAPAREPGQVLAARRTGGGSWSKVAAAMTTARVRGWIHGRPGVVDGSVESAIDPISSGGIAPRAPPAPGLSTT
jgi:hypothetical protein